MNDIAHIGIVDVDKFRGALVKEGWICRQLDRFSFLQCHFSQWTLFQNVNIWEKIFDNEMARQLTASSGPVRISGPFVSKAIATDTVMLSLSLTFLTAWRTDVIEFPWYS